jgi:hypothetical protein
MYLERKLMTVHRPYPYHPINTAQTFDELADSEGKRLEALFASVVG